jgi:hypothetical protein
MKKYEYQMYDQKDGINPDSVYELDELGWKGWELVAIRKSDSEFGGFCFYFKRELSQEVIDYRLGVHL